MSDGGPPVSSPTKATVRSALPFKLTPQRRLIHSEHDIAGHTLYRDPKIGRFFSISNALLHADPTAAQKVRSYQSMQFQHEQRLLTHQTLTMLQRGAPTNSLAVPTDPPHFHPSDTSPASTYIEQFHAILPIDPRIMITRFAAELNQTKLRLRPMEATLTDQDIANHNFKYALIRKSFRLTDHTLNATYPSIPLPRTATTSTTSHDPTSSPSQPNTHFLIEPTHDYRRTDQFQPELTTYVDSRATRLNQLFSALTFNKNALLEQAKHQDGTFTGSYAFLVQARHIPLSALSISHYRDALPSAHPVYHNVAQLIKPVDGNGMNKASNGVHLTDLIQSLWQKQYDARQICQLIGSAPALPGISYESSLPAIEDQTGATNKGTKEMSQNQSPHAPSPLPHDALPTPPLTTTMSTTMTTAPPSTSTPTPVPTPSAPSGSSNPSAPLPAPSIQLSNTAWPHSASSSSHRLLTPRAQAPRPAPNAQTTPKPHLARTNAVTNTAISHNSPHGTRSTGPTGSAYQLQNPFTAVFCTDDEALHLASVSPRHSHHPSSSSSLHPSRPSSSSTHRPSSSSSHLPSPLATIARSSALFGAQTANKLQQPNPALHTIHPPHPQPQPQPQSQQQPLQDVDSFRTTDPDQRRVQLSTPHQTAHQTAVVYSPHPDGRHITIHLDSSDADSPRDHFYDSQPSPLYHADPYDPQTTHIQHLREFLLVTTCPPDQTAIPTSTIYCPAVEHVGVEVYSRDGTCNGTRNRRHSHAGSPCGSQAQTVQASRRFSHHGLFANDGHLDHTNTNPNADPDACALSPDGAPSNPFLPFFPPSHNLSSTAPAATPTSAFHSTHHQPRLHSPLYNFTPHPAPPTAATTSCAPPPSHCPQTDQQSPYIHPLLAYDPLQHPFSSCALQTHPSPLPTTLANPLQSLPSPPLIAYTPSASPFLHHIAITTAIRAKIATLSAPTTLSRKNTHNILRKQSICASKVQSLIAMLQVMLKEEEKIIMQNEIYNTVLNRLKLAYPMLMQPLNAAGQPGYQMSGASNTAQQLQGQIDPSQLPSNHRPDHHDHRHIDANVNFDALRDLTKLAQSEYTGSLAPAHVSADERREGEDEKCDEDPAAPQQSARYRHNVQNSQKSKHLSFLPSNQLTPRHMPSISDDPHTTDHTAIQQQQQQQTPQDSATSAEIQAKNVTASHLRSHYSTWTRRAVPQFYIDKLKQTSVTLNPFDPRIDGDAFRMQVEEAAGVIWDTVDRNRDLYGRLGDGDDRHDDAHNGTVVPYQHRAQNGNHSSKRQNSSERNALLHRHLYLRHTHLVHLALLFPTHHHLHNLFLTNPCDPRRHPTCFRSLLVACHALRSNGQLLRETDKAKLETKATTTLRGAQTQVMLASSRSQYQGVRAILDGSSSTSTPSSHIHTRGESQQQRREATASAKRDKGRDNVSLGDSTHESGANRGHDAFQHHYSDLARRSHRITPRKLFNLAALAANAPSSTPKPPQKTPKLSKAQKSQQSQDTQGKVGQSGESDPCSRHDSISPPLYDPLSLSSRINPLDAPQLNNTGDNWDKPLRHLPPPLSKKCSRLIKTAYLKIHERSTYDKGVFPAIPQSSTTQNYYQASGPQPRGLSEGPLDYHGLGNGQCDSYPAYFGLLYGRNGPPAITNAMDSQWVSKGATPSATTATTTTTTTTTASTTPALAPAPTPAVDLSRSFRSPFSPAKGLPDASSHSVSSPSPQTTPNTTSQTRSHTSLTQTRNSHASRPASGSGPSTSFVYSQRDGAPMDAISDISEDGHGTCDDQSECSDSGAGRDGASGNIPQAGGFTGALVPAITHLSRPDDDAHAYPLQEVEPRSGPVNFPLQEVCDDDAAALHHPYYHKYHYQLQQREQQQEHHQQQQQEQQPGFTPQIYPLKCPQPLYSSSILASHQLSTSFYPIHPLLTPALLQTVINHHFPALSSSKSSQRFLLQCKTYSDIYYWYAIREQKYDALTPSFQVLFLHSFASTTPIPPPPATATTTTTLFVNPPTIYFSPPPNTPPTIANQSSNDSFITPTQHHPQHLRPLHNLPNPATILNPQSPPANPNPPPIQHQNLPNNAPLNPPTLQPHHSFSQAAQLAATHPVLAKYYHYKPTGNEAVLISHGSWQRSLQCYRLDKARKLQQLCDTIRETYNYTLTADEVWAISHFCYPLEQKKAQFKQNDKVSLENTLSLSMLDWGSFPCGDEVEDVPPVTGGGASDPNYDADTISNANTPQQPSQTPSSGFPSSSLRPQVINKTANRPDLRIDVGLAEQPDSKHSLPNANVWVHGPHPTTPSSPRTPRSHHHWFNTSKSGKSGKAGQKTPQSHTHHTASKEAKKGDSRATATATATATAATTSLPRKPAIRFQEYNVRPPQITHPPQRLLPPHPSLNTPDDDPNDPTNDSCSPPRPLATRANLEPLLLAKPTQLQLLNRCRKIGPDVVFISKTALRQRTTPQSTVIRRPPSILHALRPTLAPKSTLSRVSQLFASKKKNALEQGILNEVNKFYDKLDSHYILDRTSVSMDQLYHHSRARRENEEKGPDKGGHRDKNEKVDAFGGGAGGGGGHGGDKMFKPAGLQSSGMARSVSYGPGAITPITFGRVPGNTPGNTPAIAQGVGQTPDGFLNPTSPLNTTNALPANATTTSTRPSTLVKNHTTSAVNDTSPDSNQTPLNDMLSEESSGTSADPADSLPPHASPRSHQAQHPSLPTHTSYTHLPQPTYPAASNQQPHNHNHRHHRAKPGGDSYHHRNNPLDDLADDGVTVSSSSSSFSLNRLIYSKIVPLPQLLLHATQFSSCGLDLAAATGAPFDYYTAPAPIDYLEVCPQFLLAPTCANPNCINNSTGLSPYNPYIPGNNRVNTRITLMAEMNQYHHNHHPNCRHPTALPHQPSHQHQHLHPNHRHPDAVDSRSSLFNPSPSDVQMLPALPPLPPVHDQNQNQNPRHLRPMTAPRIGVMGPNAAAFPPPPSFSDNSCSFIPSTTPLDPKQLQKFQLESKALLKQRKFAFCDHFHHTCIPTLVDFASFQLKMREQQSLDKVILKHDDSGVVHEQQKLITQQLAVYEQQQEQKQQKERQKVDQRRVVQEKLVEAQKMQQLQKDQQERDRELQQRGQLEQIQELIEDKQVQATDQPPQDTHDLLQSQPQLPKKQPSHQKQRGQQQQQQASQTSLGDQGIQQPRASSQQESTVQQSPRARPTADVQPGATVAPTTTTTTTAAAIPPPLPPRPPKDKLRYSLQQQHKNQQLPQQSQPQPQTRTQAPPQDRLQPSTSSTQHSKATQSLKTETVSKTTQKRVVYDDEKYSSESREADYFPPTSSRSHRHPHRKTHEHASNRNNNYTISLNLADKNAPSAYPAIASNSNSALAKSSNDITPTSMAFGGHGHQSGLISASSFLSTHPSSLSKTSSFISILSSDPSVREGVDEPFLQFSRAHRNYDDSDDARLSSGNHPISSNPSSEQLQPPSPVMSSPQQQQQQQPRRGHQEHQQQPQQHQYQLEQESQLRSQPHSGKTKRHKKRHR